MFCAQIVGKAGDRAGAGGEPGSGPRSFEHAATGHLAAAGRARPGLLKLPCHPPFPAGVCRVCCTSPDDADASSRRPMRLEGTQSFAAATGELRVPDLVAAGRQVEIIFFSTPTPAASARSYSSGTVAESWSAMPVESKRVISASEVRPFFLPVTTSPISPAISCSCDQALAERHVDFAVVAALADVVDEDAGALHDLGIEFLVAGLVGADRRDMGARGDPFVHDDRAARRGDRHHHVGAVDDALEVASRLRIAKCRILRLLLALRRRRGSFACGSTPAPPAT